MSHFITFALMWFSNESALVTCRNWCGKQILSPTQKNKLQIVEHSRVVISCLLVGQSLPPLLSLSTTLLQGSSPI